MGTWNPRANSLFLDALELPAGRERDAFLDRQCGDDAELLGRVMRLLKASDQAGPFLEAAAADGARYCDEKQSFERPGDIIGPYKLLQKIGEGGMGVVFMAEQTQPVRRTVALKIIKPGMDTRQIVARFEAERQALALMDHPNIAKVLDAGVVGAASRAAHEALQAIPQVGSASPARLAGPTGRPYFVMELVKGLPITAYCDEQCLSVRARLALFIPVCQAIGHAHQKGIIHRDLKPSNVMIALYDGQPVPKVIDFGVAKATGSKLTDRTLFTEYGAVLGTLEYMSPEQAELNQLDVDTRSDIYSLGVLLYELLTGTTPADGQRLKKSSLLEALRTIHEDEPLRPSSRVTVNAESAALAAKRKTEPAKLKRMLAGELDWIVMKCLEKNRNRRYQTANDLVRDIESHLADRPVLARPAGTTDRMWRWCRRNRYVAALLAIVAMLVLLIAVGASLSAVRLKRESTVARAAEEQALAAEKSRRHELVEAYLAKARSVPATGVVAERDAGIGAIRGALSAVSWHELSNDQQHNLVDAAIPWLTSSELCEKFRMPLGIYHHTNAFHEIDVDPQFQLATFPTPSPVSTIVQRFGTGERRPFNLAEADAVQGGIYHAFSPSGRWLLARYLVRGAGWRYRIWDVSTGTLVFRLADIPSAEPPAFDPDEQHVLFQHGDNQTLRKFSIETGQEVAASPPRFRMSRPAYSPDGKYLAIASMHLVPEVIHAKTWDTAAMFSDIGRAASAIWHPTEPWAIFGTFDGALYRWHSQRPQALENLGRDHDAIIDWLAVSPDGRLLASSDTNARFVIRRLSHNQVLVRGTGAVLRFAADSRRIAVVDGDQLIVYKLRESPVYRQIIDPAVSIAMGKDVHYRDDAAEFSPDGRLLAQTGLRGLRLFDAHTLELVADLGLDQCGPAAFHPGGKLITTFGYFSHAWNWPLTENSVGPPVEVVPGATSPQRLAPQHGGRHAAWSADGKRLALADHRHNKVLLWDAANEVARDFVSVPNPIQVALSADGSWIAAQTEGAQGFVWNVQSRQEVLSTIGRMGMSFSPDGKWFANRGFPAVEVYRVPSWELHQLLPVESALGQRRLPPVFQPAGNLLVVSGLDQRVRLFDRETGSDVATLDDRDPSPITWLSFSPDGRRLAVVRADRTAVWDLASLSHELREVGLNVTGLPETSEDELSANPVTPTPIQVDRGSFPPGDSWYTLWQRLAEDEAAEGNWPDAVDDMNRGLFHLPDDAAVKADFLALRGTYLQRNLSFEAARDDWEAAIELVPDESTAATGLARLFVMGPPELRDPRRAIALTALLTLRDDSAPTGRLLQAIARVQLKRAKASDREVLESASSGDARGLSNDWHIAAGYFLSLDQLASGEADNAAKRADMANKLYDEHRSSLFLDQQQELDRLNLEVQTKLAAPSP